MGHKIIKINCFWNYDVKKENVPGPHTEAQRYPRAEKRASVHQSNNAQWQWYTITITRSLQGSKYPRGLQ